MSTALQDAAEARKAKLAALKKRKTMHDAGGEGEATSALETATNGSAKPAVFRFRNYDPETGLARKHLRTEEEETVEKQVEGLASKVIALDEQTRQQELDLTNIQPKKPNWDLKRDLDRKLAKLKPKTEMAVAQLIRKRLQAEKGGEAAAASLVAGFDGVGNGKQGAESEEEDDD